MGNRVFKRKKSLGKILRQPPVEKNAPKKKIIERKVRREKKQREKEGPQKRLSPRHPELRRTIGTDDAGD